MFERAARPAIPVRIQNLPTETLQICLAKAACSYNLATMTIALEYHFGGITKIVSDNHDTLVVDTRNVRAVHTNTISLVECPARRTSATMAVAADAMSMTVMLITMAYPWFAVMNATMAVAYVYSKAASCICKTGC